MASIRLDAIGKRFGDTVALDGVSLDIPDGCFFSLLGPSGCGKSTLLRMIAGLETPTAGRLLIGDEDVARLPPAARNIAMVFQSYALYPHLTVRQNIAMPLTMSRLSRLERMPGLSFLPGARVKRAQIAREVEAAAATLEIAHLLERRPGQLSGGQKQRVAVGRALVRRPRAFLLDEPLSNLDAKLRVQMREELVEVHRRFGITFVCVTHDQAEAMAMSDRIAVVLDGKVAHCDTPEAIYERPASLAVARFVGTSALNTVATTPTAGGRLSAPFTGLVLPGDMPAGDVVIGFRPEDARPCAPGAGHLEVEVQRVEYHGGSRQMLATLPGTGQDVATLRAALPAQMTPPRPGTHLGLRLTPHLAFAFDAASGARIDQPLEDARSQRATA